MLDKKTKEILQRRAMRIEQSGKILRYLRKQKKITQVDLARQLHISQPTYAGYENGHREPGTTILTELADFYDVSLDYISGRVYDGWLTSPFSSIYAEEKQAVIDMHDHAKKQCKEMQNFSYMIMEACLHGEYTTEQGEDARLAHRKYVDHILGK